MYPYRSLYLNLELILSIFWLNQAYLGYVDIEGMSRGLREKHEAPDFVQKVLWPDATAFGAKLSEGARRILATENSSFSLSQFLVENKKFPQAMPFLVRDKESMEALFASGMQRNGDDQVMIVKSFQVSRKMISFLVFSRRS